MVRRSPLIGAIVIAGLVAAGCAIPTQSVPSAIPASRVPFGLLNPKLPTTTTSQPKASVSEKIYLVGSNDRLVEANRVVSIPAPLKAVIVSLLGGPSQHEEQTSHISTAIPDKVDVISARLTKDPPVATVNFSQAFGQIIGSATELAVAQVVFTVVSYSGLSTGVVFEIDGQPITVPVANGQQTSGPVYLSQFAANAPPQ